MTRVLSIASLFPDAARPNFGLFVERSLRAAAGEEGIELRVAAPLGLPPWPLSLYPRYRRLGALPDREDWHGLAVERPRFVAVPGSNGRFAAGAMAAAALPIARAFRPDLIDAQFLFPDAVAAMQVADALGVPFIAKARGSDVSYWPHQPRVGGAMMAMASRAGRLLAVSQALARDMATLGMPREAIAVHYTGLDTARFTPGDRAAAKATLGLDGPVIATVGALIPRKGQELVLRALPSLPGVSYLLAGTGEAQGRYQALARELGVAERVRFLGSVPQAELATLYRAADIVVMPSASEGLANAWVEALACGTPIIVSDAGGAGELLVDPLAGRIVERDPTAIADAVRAILAAPPAPHAVAASLGGRFSWQRNGAELARHWREVAARAA